MTKHNLSPEEYLVETEKRFMKYVLIPKDIEDCWIWTGNVDKDGYGIMKVNYQCCRATHISFGFFVTKIPKNAILCHSCDNKACVNPKHLWLGTQQDNITDMVNKNRNYRGEDHHLAKLNRENIYEIREKIEQGYKLQEIANLFGVTLSNISKIKTKKNWKWIK